MDEMWSFYHDKAHQIWLWWAVEHTTNMPVAFTFGTREHKATPHISLSSEQNMKKHSAKSQVHIEIFNFMFTGHTESD